MEGVCPICLDNEPNIDIMTKCCKQFFHKTCYQEWLKYSHICPYCRYIVNKSFDGKYGKKNCTFEINNDNLKIVYHKNKKEKILYFNIIKSLSLEKNKLAIEFLSDNKMKTKYSLFKTQKELLDFYDCLWGKMMQCYERIKGSLIIADL